MAATRVAQDVRRLALLACAHGQRRFGWPGWLGLALLAAAAGLLASALMRQQDMSALATRERAAAPRVSASAPQPASARSPMSALPPRESVPLLLSRVQRAAHDQGLDWPRAEYRSTSPTAEAPGGVEIRCTLKGAYPAMRRFVTALLLDMPTLTFKDLVLVRQGAESAEVELRLTIAVYVAEVASLGTGAHP